MYQVLLYVTKPIIADDLPILLIDSTKYSLCLRMIIFMTNRDKLCQWQGLPKITPLLYLYISSEERVCCKSWNCKHLSIIVIFDNPVCITTYTHQILGCWHTNSRLTTTKTRLWLKIPIKRLSVLWNLCTCQSISESAKKRHCAFIY